jgi:hypothetical protein
MRFEAKAPPRVLLLLVHSKKVERERTTRKLDNARSGETNADEVGYQYGMIM